MHDVGPTKASQIPADEARDSVRQLHRIKDITARREVTDKARAAVLDPFRPGRMQKAPKSKTERNCCHCCLRRLRPELLGYELLQEHTELKPRAGGSCDSKREHTPHSWPWALGVIASTLEGQHPMLAHLTKSRAYRLKARPQHLKLRV